MKYPNFCLYQKTLTFAALVLSTFLSMAPLQASPLNEEDFSNTQTSPKTVSTPGNNIELPSDVIIELFKSMDIELVNPSVCRTWFTLITGYDAKNITSKGLNTRPSQKPLLSPIKVFDFESFSPETLAEEMDRMSSYIWFSRIATVKNIPVPYWPSLLGTQVHTVKLGSQNIGPQGAGALALNLQRTEAETVHIGYNNIGPQGAVDFVRNLQQDLTRSLEGTRVRTIYMACSSYWGSGCSILSP